MPKIKFVDLNWELVEKVKELGIEAKCSDYFIEAYKTSRCVLMTASNPMFTFGGGIDYLFAKHFPELIKYKRTLAGGMERIMNIVFAITVNEQLKADKEIVKKALKFAIQNTHEGETLLISGVGTGIGGMSIEDFCQILKELIDPKQHT